MRVYISHSLNQMDHNIVESIVNALRTMSIEVIISSSKFQSSPIIEKIRSDIRQSDCVFVLLTKSGADSAWVEQEIGIAIEQGKPIIPMLERGIRPPGAIAEQEYIEFDRSNYLASLGSAVKFLDDLRRNNFWTVLGLTLILLGILIFAAISWFSSDTSEEQIAKK